MGIEKIVAKIQIFSVLGKNGVMFADFLRRNMTVLSSGEHELEFNCFMSSKANAPKGWTTLEYILKQKHTSLNHTIGMNRALEYIDGDYVVFSDTDVAILAPNWDQYLIEAINKHGIDILGVGHWDNPRRYQKFPVVTFFMAKSLSHMRAQPDMRPNLIQYSNKLGVGAKQIKIKTEQEAFIYGKRIGSRILQDSGWNLPWSYKMAGLRGKVLTPASAYALQYVPQIWNFKKQLGICHKGKGSKRRQSHAMKFHKSVAGYVLKTYGIKIDC